MPLQAVLKHAADIEDFVEKGSVTLASRPQTVAEIGLVNAEQAKLVTSKSMIKPLFDAAENKNKLLRQACGAQR